MIDRLCKLAQTLEDSGFIEAAGAVDGLIRSIAGGSPDHPLDEMEDEWKRHPKIPFGAVGKIHAEQEIGKHQYHNLSLDEDDGKARADMPKPHALQSLLNYQEHGPHGGAKFSHEQAMEYAKAYVVPFGLTAPEKDHQLAEVSEHFSKQ